MKIKKNGGGGGVRRGGGGGSDQGLGWGRGSKVWGKVGDVGYGGCKPRINGIDKCK